MALQQAHLDAVVGAATTLRQAQTQAQAARLSLDATLDSFSPLMNEGEMRAVGAAVTVVVKQNGKVQYLEIPGMTDPDPPAA